MKERNNCRLKLGKIDKDVHIIALDAIKKSKWRSLVLRIPRNHTKRLKALKDFIKFIND